MVSDRTQLWLRARKISVLILVLMEYGLWLRGGKNDDDDEEVLILVLMEYGLWLYLLLWEEIPL